MEKPEGLKSQVVYGNVVYWLCIIAALVCTIGTILSIAFPADNIIDPHYLFYNIWQGYNPDAVWQASGGFPGGHFWMQNLNMWDGFTQFGLVIGCLSASIALAGAAIGFLIQKSRSYGWAVLALFIIIIIYLSAAGIYKV